MISYSKEIERIKNPKNIHEAVYASSPHSLKKIFEKDLIVSRLIDGGKDVVPLIAKELENKGLKLPEITLACFAYILLKVDPDSAAKILQPLFAKAIEKPGPFFINFAAHALRLVVKLPTKLLGTAHTKNELLETLEASKRLIKSDKEE